MEDIRDIKGVVPLPQDLWWLWVLLIVVIIAGFALWLWLRRKPAVAAMRLKALPSPFEVAMDALRRLREESLSVEKFYTRLSDIVRRYLEGRFGLRAPERTTEEFLHEVSRDDALSSEHKNLLGDFLQESDLVKFARYRPGEADMARAFGAAERFVQETRPATAEEVVTAQ